jgi:hypothetical protein
VDDDVLFSFFLGSGDRTLSMLTAMDRFSKC